MATTAKGGPKRVKRTAKKKATSDVTDVVEKGTEEEVVAARAESSISKPSLFKLNGIRSNDVTAFLRQLIMMLEAGTPILRALKTLSERGERQAMRALIADIAQFVENGNALWQAFDRHPRYFDAVFVNLIKASEASGTLTTVLKRLTSYREDREMMRKRVKGAMLYPTLLVAACFGVMLLLTKIVVPQFATLFENINAELPAFTEMFLTLSNIVGNFWWLPILAIIVLVLAYQMWFVRNPLRRLYADRIKLRIPIVGGIVQRNALVEMTRTLSLLLRSGLSMMSALELTRNAVHNRAVAQTLQNMRDSVEEGGNLETPLRAATGTIPPVVADMFVTGEESGHVDEIAEQVADVYEEEVKIAVETLGEALQPVFTIIVGLAVVVLFVALFFPLVSMIDQIASAM